MHSKLPNKLELDVIEHIARSENLESLRAQIPYLRVRNRKMTGVGFFTRFDLAEEGQAKVDKRLGDRTVGKSTRAEIEGMQYEAGFVLYLEEGKIDCLEGYTVDEPWPDKVERYRIFDVRID